MKKEVSARQRTVAIVGAGYIADFHARALRAIGADLVAVCDSDEYSAQAFAKRWNIDSFATLEALLDRHEVSVVHVLTPPDSHYALARAAIDRGLSVFLEKPMCTSAQQCRELIEKALNKGVEIGVSHNMIFIEAPQRLRDAVFEGTLGEIDYLAFNYFMELGPIRSGPFHAWMLREPGNPLLEVGAHPISGLIDLLGVPDQIEANADREHELPTGVKIFRRWRIHGTKGRAAFDINIELGPGFDVKQLSVRGQTGFATADLNANIATIDTATPLSIDFDRYKRASSIQRQIKRQARSTLRNYLLSRAKLANRGSPYEASFVDCLSAFYDGLEPGVTMDRRISMEAGLQVLETCERALKSAKVGAAPVSAPKRAGTAVAKPTVLVLGGTGFIGSHLVDLLTRKGQAVRVVSRGKSRTATSSNDGAVEVVRADMRSRDDLERLLDGIQDVYHLATTDAKTWPEFLEREVRPTEALGEACLAAGVRRLVYAGTIDSYYAGAGAGTITEDTPLDQSSRRNNYARAKAEAERRLLKLHEEQGLPVVFARPGIVIGRGGNAFHWGVGKWSSPSICQVWGDGRNKLPIVLVRDVAEGLYLAMHKPGIEGRSFLLVDEPLLSARDYLAALEEITGMPLDVRFTPTWKSFLADFVKWPVKRVTGHPDGKRVPSYRDWESRTQRAVFDSSRTQSDLGWSPAGTKERLVTEGLEASLESWLAVRD